jgi:hypothetical protein
MDLRIEANKINWKKGFSTASSGCTEEKVAAAVSDERSSRLLHEVKLQRGAIKKRPSVRFHFKSKKILDDNGVKTSLSELHTHTHTYTHTHMPVKFGSDC